MTIGRLVNHIKALSKIAEIYEHDVIVNWINEAEQAIWANEITDLDSKVMTVVEQPFELPYKIRFENIVKMFRVDDNENRLFEYSLSSLDYLYHNSFYKKNGMVSLNPIPDDEIKIEIIYRRLPPFKKGSLEEIELPNSFIDLYVSYVMYNIHMIQQEIDLSNNYLIQYNQRVAAVKDWWSKVR